MPAGPGCLPLEGLHPTQSRGRCIHCSAWWRSRAGRPWLPHTAVTWQEKTIKPVKLTCSTTNLFDSSDEITIRLVWSLQIRRNENTDEIILAMGARVNKLKLWTNNLYSVFLDLWLLPEILIGFFAYFPTWRCFQDGYSRSVFKKDVFSFCSHTLIFGDGIIYLWVFFFTGISLQQTVLKNWNLSPWLYVGRIWGFSQSLSRDGVWHFAVLFIPFHRHFLPFAGLHCGPLFSLIAHTYEYDW